MKRVNCLMTNLLIFVIKGPYEGLRSPFVLKNSKRPRDLDSGIPVPCFHGLD